MRVGVLEKNGDRGWFALDGDRARRFDGSPFDGARLGSHEIQFSSADLRAPVRPSKIICIGRNYAAHAKELGNDVPKEPLIFLKPPSSVIGPGEAIVLPKESEKVEHEAELGVVIGQRVKHASRERALEAVYGYTCVCDVTARDLQKKDGQWSRAKGFDTFCPVGPWIETELDPKDLEIRCTVDGAVKQHGRTSQMIFDVASLIAYVSAAFTLEPGDLLVTGTPEGVGPLLAGNKLVVSVQGIGELTVGVIGIVTRRAVITGAVIAVAAAISVGVALHTDAEPCAPGFTREGPRCRARGACPAPLVSTDHGCDGAERDVVDIPAMTVVIGPADWEAEGRVAPRTLRVDAFAIDRLEVTAGRFCRSGRRPCDDDGARAAHTVPLAEARAYCIERGGRLPTEDEWLAAAGGDKPRRYPWGDTGAVCRRAAWGLAAGPCASGADGPDTAGAHPTGATPLGVHDLAGNVAEWVELSPPSVRGGSWKTTLATELRTWPRAEVSPAVAERGDPTIGFRCAYSAVRSSSP